MEGNGLEAQPDEGWTLGEAVVLTNLVGIGKGFVHDDDEGMAEEGGIIVAFVSHGFAHDSTSEILVTIEEGVDDEMAVVEMPCQQLGVLFVGELNQYLT